MEADNAHTASPDFDAAIEALVFAAEEPVSAVVLGRSWAEATGNEAPRNADVEAAVERINQHLEDGGRPYSIEKWGGGYRFATRKELAPFLRALFVSDRQRKLSRTLMESLAILAYRQPVSRTELEFVRGVDCDYAIRKLLEFGLIDVVGRAERIGRPLLYGTTDRFLELFGLHSLDDLPNLRELESILDDPAFQKEKAKLLMTTAVQLPLSAQQDDDGSEESEAKESVDEENESRDEEETEQ